MSFAPGRNPMTFLPAMSIKTGTVPPQEGLSPLCGRSQSTSRAKEAVGCELEAVSFRSAIPVGGRKCPETQALPVPGSAESLPIAVRLGNTSTPDCIKSGSSQFHSQVAKS